MVKEEGKVYLSVEYLGCGLKKGKVWIMRIGCLVMEGEKVEFIIRYDFEIK